MLTPRLAIPDRSLPVPVGLTNQRAKRVLVRYLSTRAANPTITLSPRSDDAWLRLYQQQVPVDVLTAVIHCELVFGTARTTMLDTPDGTRYVGLSALCVTDDPSVASPGAAVRKAVGLVRATRY
ncbi:hypothetical protein ABFA25_01085 [Mycobacterium lepromatosis]|nr:hypothetical protein [Mycobacterium lepromatosis]